MTTEQALRDTLISPNITDTNLENANVVDVLNKVAWGAKAIAESITPQM